MYAHTYIHSDVCIHECINPKECMHSSSSAFAFILQRVLHKEAAQTCRRRGVAGACGACCGPRRVLELAFLARRACAAVGPRVPGDARAVFSGVACCIHVCTDAHTHTHTRVMQVAPCMQDLLLMHSCIQYVVLYVHMTHMYI